MKHHVFLTPGTVKLRLPPRQSRGISQLISPSPDGLRDSSVALAFQIRAIPKSALQKKIRDLTEEETAELELATDEALGRVEPPPK